MNIYSILTLLGGIAFFLFGMNTMSKSLEKMAGGKLERTLKRMTSNLFKSLLLGAGITVAIQSSTAMTVMLVGLVNSGVMEMHQTIGVIMGSNIGTTFTAWILSLAGIQSDNVFVNLLKPENFSPLFALVGVIFILASKKQRLRDVGRVMVGFAILMYGMELMKTAMAPLAEMPQFREAMVSLNNPILGVVVGAVMTFVIQSSAASVGILQALAMTGVITYGMALPIIMGQNIGTCLSTALFSSIGVNRSAKQVTMVHIIFNAIGTVVCLILFFGVGGLLDLPIINETAGAVGVAACHTIFNVFTTIILLPFSKQLGQLSKKIIPDEPASEQAAFLDPLLLRTPGVAVSECVSMTNRMGSLAYESLVTALGQLSHYDPDREAVILANEDQLDTFEDKLGNYLVLASQHGISMTDSRTVSRLLHAIGDFERMGDHALNLQETAKEIYEKQSTWSPEGDADLKVLFSALEEILNTAFDCFLRNDLATACMVEPLEETIDQLIEEIRLRHIQRLQNGACTIQSGFILNDILTNVERVSDHCSNIAVSVIEEQASVVDSHLYLHDIKKDASFGDQLKKNMEKYKLSPGK